MEQTIGKTKQGVDIASWVMKCNPAIFNVAEEIAVNGSVGNWSVRETYRLDLMQPGQPCLLWVTGSKTSPVPAGIYAIGTLGQAADGGVLELSRYSEGVRPKYERQVNGVRPFAVCDLEWLAEPITRDALLQRHPAFGRSELVRSPQGASPAVLTPEEFDAVMSFDLTRGPVTDQQLEAFEKLAPSEGRHFLLVHRPDGPSILCVEHPDEVQIIELDVQTGDRVGDRKRFPGWRDALTHVIRVVGPLADDYPLPHGDTLQAVVTWEGATGNVFLVRRENGEWVERVIADDQDVEEPQLFASLTDYLRLLADDWDSGETT